MPDPGHSAFDPELLLCHESFLRALARGLIADPARAEDVVQDTWTAAIAAPPARTTSLRGWLATVARNLARQHGRGERRRSARERVAARGERVPSADEIVEREAVRRAVVEALAELAEPYRDVLLLRFYEGLAPREIAARLELPVETVRTRTRRGLEALRRALDLRHGGERGLWAAGLASFADAPARTAAPMVPVLVVVAVVGVIAGGAWLALPRSEVAADPALVAAVAPAGLGSRSPSPGADLGARELVRAIAAEPVSAQQPSPPEAKPAARVTRVSIAVPERVRSGIVTDSNGKPIADAIVFAGNQIDARGDEPFKPFRPQWDGSESRTDAAGRYLLHGARRTVTAWHADHGSRTVGWDDAATIALPGLAVLRGRVVDGHGAAQAGVKLVLDRESEAVTDAEGRFEFERVEPGVRGIQIERVAARDLGDGRRSRPQGPFFGVRFEGSSDREPVLVCDLPPSTLRLTGEPAVHRGCVVGLARVFAMPEAFVEGERSALSLGSLMPGPHFLFSRDGLAVRFEVGSPGERVEQDIGSRTLTVHAPAGLRLYAVQEDDDGFWEFVHLMGGRASARAVPESGELVWDHLPRGRRSIGIEKQGKIVEVDLEDADALVILE